MSQEEQWHLVLILWALVIVTIYGIENLRAAWKRYKKILVARARARNEALLDEYRMKVHAAAIREGLPVYDVVSHTFKSLDGSRTDTWESVEIRNKIPYPKLEPIHDRFF